jgi:folate-dependent phosphoribosylglycinamide formyltransferase PurN
MRIVVLCSSVYSETACAMTVRLAQSGCVPIGVLTLSTIDAGTLLRKLGQWGLRDVARYAGAKLFPWKTDGGEYLRNPYLKPLLTDREHPFRNVRDVAREHDFSIVTCSDQNAASSVAQLRQWAPDLIIFTGGNILRKELLDVPRLGVLNMHLGPLPEIRGMSSPEWSLLNDVPIGVTVHYIDSGIDTGPILRRCEFPDAAECVSLADLRNRLIAFGIERAAEVVLALDRGSLTASPQSELDRDNQFFVMHDWLQARAVKRLRKSSRSPVVAETAHG